MRRGAWRAGLLVVAFVLSTGCASIPDSGDVQTYSGAVATSDEQVIRTIARTPPAGASKTEIVSGFLAASASFEDDHAFARGYLTDATAKAWNPDAGVAVYDSEPGYQLGESGDEVLMIALRSAGTISGRGEFAQPAPGEKQYRTRFGVVKQRGEWRIKSLPAGLVLGTGDVNRVYRSVNLYFLDVAGGVLVPDTLFLPAQRPGLATALTRELLAGPTEWLAPAVRTGFPKGTRLAVDAVPVDDGVARVDLDRVAVAASGEERRQIAAQVAYTLTQLPTVTGVRLTLEGVPFSIPGVGPVTSASDWESFNPDAEPLDGSAYAITDGHVSVVTDVVTPLAGYFGRTRNLTAAAVAHDGRLVAGVQPTTGGGADVRIGDPRAADAGIVYQGQSVSSVSFDRLNSAWIADRFEGRTRVRTLRAGGETLAVRVDGLGTRSIESMRVSRDGARVALVVAARPGGTGTLLVGRIERAAGIPVVAGLHRVESSFTSVSDVAWARDASLLVVAQRAAEPAQSFLVGTGGASVVAAGAVPSMIAVAACPGRPNLAGSATDTLWVDRGNGWRLLTKGTEPIYPG